MAKVEEVPSHIFAGWERLIWAPSVAAGASLLGLLNVVAQAKDQDAAFSFLSAPLALLILSAACGAVAAIMYVGVQASDEEEAWATVAFFWSAGASVLLLATAIIWLFASHGLGWRLQPKPALTAPPIVNLSLNFAAPSQVHSQVAPPATATVKKGGTSGFHRP